MGKKLTEMKRKEMLNSLCMEHLKSMYKDKCYWLVGLNLHRQPKTKMEWVKHFDRFVYEGKLSDSWKGNGNSFLIKLIKKKARFKTGQKHKLWIKAKHKCEICKKVLDTVPDVHHIKPVEEGGYCLENNGIVVCPTCHRKAGSDVFTRKQLKSFIKYRC